MTTLSSLTEFLACSTCMADRGGVTQQAANAGIFVMLGGLVFVFGCIGLVFFSFARRAARLRRAALLASSQT